jgi:hypothetical protein
MTERFILKEIVSLEDCQWLKQNFGFRGAERELIDGIQNAFQDYVLLAVSEEKESRQQRDQHYIEAMYFIDKASKLLQGQPHPAGAMSQRLDKMKSTLEKVVANESEVAEDRAKRFVELNLVRKLRDLWLKNTNTPFYVGQDGSGKAPHDYLATLFRFAARSYPEVSWFSAVSPKAIDYMVGRVK